LACLFAYCSGGGSRLALIGGEKWGDGGGGKLGRGSFNREQGSTNYLVELRACVVGCSSPCSFCPSDGACLVSNLVPTFAVAAEMRPVVIRGWAAARVVLFCAVSTRLSLSARYCTMAVGPALVALGHDVPIMEYIAILG
jgi:hypothetical protein